MVQRRDGKYTAVPFAFFSKLNTNYDEDEALPKPQKTQWRDQAFCRAIPLDQAMNTFFKADRSLKYDEYEKARKVCTKLCPVKDDCLAAALHEEGNAGMRQRYGMRGGATPRERREMYCLAHDNSNRKNNRTTMSLIRRHRNRYTDNQQQPMRGIDNE